MAALLTKKTVPISPACVAPRPASATASTSATPPILHRLELFRTTHSGSTHQPANVTHSFPPRPPQGHPPQSAASALRPTRPHRRRSPSSPKSADVHTTTRLP